MTPSNNVYRNPHSGHPLITTISSNCNTPVLKVKFCNLLNPFYYKNSLNIPRYSITCVIEADKNKDFLDIVRTIEKNEGVSSIIKEETMRDGENVKPTGNFLIKFQGKDLIPVYTELGEYITLEDELAAGENVQINYDILRYTKKNTAQTEHGISFKPSRICLIAKGK